MVKKTKRRTKAAADTTDARKKRRKRVTGAAAAATMLPLAISLLPGAMSLRLKPAEQPQAVAPKGKPKQFTIPINNLREWASKVLTTMNDVKIEGNSGVHKEEADCEIHFGAHAPSFQGDPNGLVLEPMNACSLPFPGQTEQKDSDYLDFAKRIKGKTVTVVGVPRIWPEHLHSGGEASNPDHAVEVHPLTIVEEADGNKTDFTSNLSAGAFEGGVSSPTAQSIVKKTQVILTRNGDNADIDFFGGQIGNFTVLELNVSRKSIIQDKDGSFLMLGEVVLDDGETIPVRMVTINASPFNDAIAKLRSRGRGDVVSLGQVLVLFSVSPQAMLDAANRSNGQPTPVNVPIQLILYGPAE